MTKTTVPSMIVADIEPRVRPASPFVMFKNDPMACEHVFEPNLWEHGGAYCALCGSLARWVNDPRVKESR
jgi:hypothetical protein